MIIHDYEQGSEEWHKSRLGLPTASNFSKILTGTGKASTQKDGYMKSLLVERITGKPSGFEGNSYTERGHEIEPEARAFYAMKSGDELTEVGFCTDDKAQFGASPDCLVGDDGLLEIKSTIATTHIGYLEKPEKLPSAYASQIHGQLLVTGRKWCDFIAYHPDLPAVIIRVERDESYLVSLISALHKFSKELDERHAALMEKL